MLPSLCLSGCDDSLPGVHPDALVLFRDSPFEDPSFFAGKPGSIVGPLTVQVLGPEIRGVPGRNGRRDPVEGIEVDFRFKFKLKKKNPYLEGMPFISDLLGRDEKDDDEEGGGERPAGKARGGDPDAPREPASETREEAGIGGSDGGPSGSAVAAGARSSPRAGEEAPSSIPAFIPHKEFTEGTSFESEDENDPSEIQSATVRTDANGLARIWVKLGDFVGEYRVEAQVRTEYHQRRPLDFWLVSGLEILSGSPVDREGPTGSEVDIALGLFRQDGEAIEEDDDRAVLYSILGPHSASAGATLEKDKDRTNSRGISAIKLELGERSGSYEVLAEFEPTETSPAIRGVRLEFYALNRREWILTIIGGASLLLIGLRWLTSGLIVQMSSRLHLPTASFARDRVAGFFGGLAVGGTFLSSSRFHSQLIMFANGGLLLAAGAGAQILGSGVGKTLIIHVLAFDVVSRIGFPAIAAGLILSVLPERVRSKAWGNVLLGLGIAIVGFTFIERAAEVSASSPGLTALLNSWDPGAGERPGISSVLVFCAVVLWAGVAGFAVRSSNLVVLFSVAFAAHGVCSSLMFVAVVIGAGLGASCSNLVASMSRSREARRVALLAVLYQTAGALAFVVLSAIPIGERSLILHAVEWLTPGQLFHVHPENVAHHMAMFYTLFYLGTALLLLPLAGRVDRLARRIIPRDPVNEAVKPYRLDPGLVEVPALAVNQAVREVTYLVEVVRKTVAESFDAFRYQDLNLTDQIARREESAESVQRDVSRYLLLVAQNSRSLRVTSRVQGLQAAIGNLVRIGEEGERLRDLALIAVEEKIEVPEEILRDLTELYDLLISQFENILSLLESPDLRVEENAVKVGERLARSATRIEGNWVQRIRAGGGEEGAPLAGVSYATLALCREAYTRLSLVARHLGNIAERMRVLSVR